MPDPCLISLVICTYNNADSLALTLNQLTKQAVDAVQQFEIIVVDNNSPDHTQTVVQQFIAASEIKARYIFEPRQGLSHARNTGLNAATGHYILFTDDDAEIPSTWLAAYATTLNQTQADCLYSKIHVIWDMPQPWWFISDYNPCFVELNYGDTLLNITDIHHEFYGKNFCVKKELILAQGGFDPALGRIGTKLVAGEETLLYRGLIAKKCRVIYFPQAAVGHRLKPKEYSEAHIKKLFLDGAYSAMHIANVMATKKIAGRPLGALIHYLKKTVSSAALAAYFYCLQQKARSYFHYLTFLKSLTFIKLWVLRK